MNLFLGLASLTPTGLFTKIAYAGIFIAQDRET